MHITGSEHPETMAIEDFRRDLRVLEREIVRQLEFETGCCGVTLSQCHVLLELSAAEMSLSGLAEALDLDASTLSRTVDGIVRTGLVERTADPADRRSIRLTLTAAGRDKVASIDEKCNSYYAALLGKLTGAERGTVVQAIGLLAGIMRKFRTAAPGECGCEGSPCCHEINPAPGRKAKTKEDRNG